MMDGKEALNMVLGSFLLSLGISIAAVYLFHGSLPVAYMGFILFSMGYKVMKHNPGRDWSLGRPDLETHLATAFGILLITMGFLEGVAAIDSLNVWKTVSSGLLVVAGYVSSHVAENEVLL